MNDVLLAYTKLTEATTRIKTSRSDDQYEEDPLPKLLDESEAAFGKYGDAQKRYEAAKQKIKNSNSKAARSALKAASSAVKATKAVFNIKSKRYSDTSVAGVDDVNGRQTDRSVKQTMNSMLNTMSVGAEPLRSSLATSSAYIYRQLGSKYMRIPDLDNKTLVIVQLNRRKCGPKRIISDPLQSMIRTLAFKQQIDQSEYDKLSIDDKKLFKKILAITHLQYNFHDQLEDPLDSLRAEYDKLKGELELGNDNSLIIKQLKLLSVDMYSNRLISDSEFKDIIVRLI
ncbi:unnamed protein product [Phytophthora lilii]|uniref:Unnamed protein product n=1 Tax=Phytophthora lilii TaxID=2077276 RepID=A0A9W6YLJ9_9STRA|nr:unnamed protein product [Phytophthora lilii]